MKYLSSDDIKTIESNCEKIVNDKCEQEFLLFKDKILKSILFHELPEGLLDKTKSFCDEQKHLFYRGYRNKIVDQMKTKLNKIWEPEIVKKELKPLTIVSGEKFSDQKDRMFLEAYFINRKNARQAAFSLGVAKSTFHDWLKDNQELILSEERKGMT